MSIFDRIKHDIAQEYYTENYPNDGQRFVAWYLRNIHGLDPSEAKSCITDGPDDKKIDAVYVSDDDETVYIIQGKFVQKKVDATPLMEIHSAWLQINDLQHLQENANSVLAGKVNEISEAIDEGYNVCFELLIASEFTKPAQKEIELYRSKFEDSDTINARLVVLDIHSIEARYNEILNKNPSISYNFTVEAGRYMDVKVSGKRAVIAVISLRECINIPGIQDGSLFRKNVRQSLGKNAKVNKEISASIKINPGEFFFLNNGITAICSAIEFSGETMIVKDLSVVNGCQTLTAIFNNGEAVRKSEGGYIVFRFYEITENDKADKISTSTNTQNRVSARDLCSNDKHILSMKREYEHCYSDGQFITKRGELQETGKNPLHVIDLGILGKLLLSWYLQKPYGVQEEPKIFGKEGFHQIFHRQYTPEKIQALNEIYTAVRKIWEDKSNPLQIDDAIFALKKRAIYLHIFAVSFLLCQLNKAPNDTTPSPDVALNLMKNNGNLEDVLKFSGECLNEAFLKTRDEAQEKDEILDVKSWIKTTASIIAIRSEVRKSLRPHKQEDKDFVHGLRETLKMSKRDFEPVRIS